MEEEPIVNYREEILRLVSEGKIKHTTRYIEKQSDESLKKIYKNYIAKQLDETNEQITKTLIDQLSELLTSMEMVEEKEELKDDLQNNELFKRDVKKYLVLRNSLRSLDRIGVRCDLSRKTHAENPTSAKQCGGGNERGRKIKKNNIFRNVKNNVTKCFLRLEK